MQHNTPSIVRSTRSRALVRGVTLVETLCVVSILATSLGLASPSLTRWRDQQALHGVAAQLETDIQYARSQAVASNTVVHLATHTDNGGSCYVVHSGSVGDCSCSATGAAVCTESSRVWRSVSLPNKTAVQLASAPTSIAFNPNHGTVTPTTTFKLATAHAAVHQVVNIMGRVRSCSPTASTLSKAC